MNTPSDDLMLVVKNLQTEFATGGAEVIAVKEASFTIRRGETIGIVGESGSGKSVTALSIMRLLPASGHIKKGSIQFYGKHAEQVNLHIISDKAMQHLRGKEIAMIFQEPMTALNPVFSCGAQVMEAMRVHLQLRRREAKERTIALLQKVRLQDPHRIFNAYPHELSGGQKQRVMIAMAISCNPSLLIADEPTTALDVTVQSQILQLLDDLRKEYAMSMLFITHDLGVVAEIADRVLVMFEGNIVEQGTVLEIFSNPQHPYTKGLLACRPVITKKMRRLPTVSDFLKEQTNGPENVLVAAKIRANATMELSPTEIASHLDRLQQQAPVLRVQNLKTVFPAGKNFFGRVKSMIHAVDDVSFEVFPGEVLGLVGESGCGKTTLGRSILQLIKPVSGKVIFEGKDLTQLSNDALRPMRKNLQIIFQDPYASLNPRLSVGNAIREAMMVHQLYDSRAEQKEKVFELLQKVNLPPTTYDKYPHEFSGGQRQRIAIARALALHPKFIICDECVSSLDVSIQAQVLNLLLQLREEFGFSYIFISHDLSVVKFMSDRMLVMNNGKIEEAGPAEEIYAQPASDYTRQLINAIPKGDLETIRRRTAERQLPL